MVNKAAATRMTAATGKPIYNNRRRAGVILLTSGLISTGGVCSGAASIIGGFGGFGGGSNASAGFASTGLPQAVQKRLPLGTVAPHYRHFTSATTGGCDVVVVEA